MREMSPSVLRVARTALRIGEQGLPRYSCPRSRHDFTQAQLFALLVVRQRLQLDYRGLVSLLAEWRELRQALGLPRVPHYSTLCYAAHRLLGKKGGPSACSPARSRPPSPRGSSARRAPWRSTARGSAPTT